MDEEGANLVLTNSLSTPAPTLNMRENEENEKVLTSQWLSNWVFFNDFTVIGFISLSCFSTSNTEL